MTLNFYPDEDYNYFTEELPDADHALSETGKEKLHNAMTKVASNDRALGFFTCRNYIFLVGSYNSEMFILDTHPVPPSAGGRFTAILKRFTGSKEHACGTCCNWLWNRRVFEPERTSIAVTNVQNPRRWTKVMNK